MSPASYLTAPPRVASRQYISGWTRFSGLRWPFFSPRASPGSSLVGLRAWRAWQAFVSLAAAGDAAVERLAAATEQLQARSEAAATRTEELNAAVARLRRTQARVRILLGAWGEVTSLLRAAHVLSPR